MSGLPQKRTILIAEDELAQRRALSSMATKAGYLVLEAADGGQALKILQGPDGASISALIVDLSMPKVGGLEVINTIRPLRPRLPIIVLTAHTSLSNAVESMRAGANDFIAKPASPERLTQALAMATNEAVADGELRPLSEKMGRKLSFDQLVGKADPFLAAIEVARKAAATSAPVLIEGESGVGKELIAQSIHTASPRANAPFIVVNCGALPGNLVESLLFGHEKGAFTGAIDRHSGKFAEANGGTIFLDEIGELPLDMQVKLLRVLQEGEVEPVGSRTTIKVDVRVVSATNRELAEEVAANRFREDLFYRLNVVQLRMPPLRDRREDIPELIRHFIKRVKEVEGVHVHGISDEALGLLRDYHWPGNVRQLQNAIFRAVVLCDGDRLTLRDFPQILAQAQRGEVVPQPDNGFGERRNLLTAWREPPELVPGEGRLTMVNTKGHVRTLQDLEAEAIRFALNRYRGRMSEVARRLGIGRSTLYRRLSELDIDVSRSDSHSSF